MDRALFLYLKEQLTVKGRLDRSLRWLGIGVLAEMLYPIKTTRERYQQAARRVKSAKEEIGLAGQSAFLPDGTREEKSQQRLVVDLPADIPPREQSGQQPISSNFDLTSLPQPLAGETPSGDGHNKPPTAPTIAPNWRQSAEPGSSKIENARGDGNRLPAIFISQGMRRDLVPISTLGDLFKEMRKINGLGPITPNDVWNKLQVIRQILQDPTKMSQHERVQWGQWRILYTLDGGDIFFRIGHRSRIYATKKLEREK